MVANSAVSPKDSDEVELVLDARSRGRWAGTDPEPRPGMRSGHIPHSVSIPFNTLLKSNILPEKNLKFTTLLDAHNLKEALREGLGEGLLTQILEGKRSVVSSCGSGMSAAIIWLALRVLGTESAIYDEVIVCERLSFFMLTVY
jgi:thiosulfate/3-mercaptopyruvate sulfurtransferase